MSEQSKPNNVYVVDDDEAVRDSLKFLLAAEGFEVTTFESGDAFLAAIPAPGSGCVLLDIRMPGTTGMEVQQALVKQSCELPIIFITGHGDVPMAVEAMQTGAFDFIQKPFRDDELIDRVHQALTVIEQHQDDIEKRKKVLGNFESLTPREREVMDMVTRGLANKVIAMDLDLSQRTVEIHRARVMEKMGARSLAELVRMSVYMTDQAG